MEIFKKGKSKDVNIKEEVPTIEELAKDMLANRERAKAQKALIPTKIDELTKELNSHTYIPEKKFKSFDFDDIKENAAPRESNDIISKEIVSLMFANEMPIFNDKKYMESIRKYAAAIRPIIVELEKKEWENLKKIDEKEAELEAYRRKEIEPIWEEYLYQEAEIERLINTVYRGMVNTYGGREYNKQLKPDGQLGFYRNKSMVEMVDVLLLPSEDSKLRWIATYFGN